MKVNLSKENLISIASILIILALGYNRLSEYLVFDFSLILFIMVLPFLITYKTNIISFRYGIVSLLLLSLFFIFKLDTLYFFSVVSSLFFIYESRFGKLTNIPILLLMIISPTSQHLNNVVGFEIRLKLTEWAGIILNYFYDDLKQVGNQILISGNPFSVDPECMGLNMMVISFFIGIVFIALEQKKNNSRYSYLSIFSILFLSFILSSLSNLVRIILLIMFESPPNTISHEFIGVFCFSLYVVIPLWFIVKRIPNKIYYPEKIKNIIHSKKSIYLILTLILVLFFSIKFGNFKKQDNNQLNFKSININTSEFICNKERLGVLKYEKKDILLYIKPSVNFYASDHSPIVCWRGNGYNIQNETTIKLNGIDIYFCTLSQNNDVLYSTWWYDSGEDKTKSQFKWRTETLINGRKYRLVNVISYDKEKLLSETEKLLKTKLFNNKE